MLKYLFYFIFYLKYIWTKKKSIIHLNAALQSVLVNYFHRKLQQAKVWNRVIVALNSEYNYNSDSMCCLTIIACLSSEPHTWVWSLQAGLMHQTAEIWAQIKHSEVESVAEVCLCGYWRERDRSSQRSSGDISRTIQKKSQHTASDTCSGNTNSVEHDGAFIINVGVWAKNQSDVWRPVQSSIEVCSITWAHFRTEIPANSNKHTALRYFTPSEQHELQISHITAEDDQTRKSCFIRAKHQILYIRSVLWKLFTLQEPNQ